MASLKLSQALSAEYQELYQAVEIKPDRFAEVDAIVDKIIEKRSDYEDVSEKVDAPWYFVGAIHSMESGLRFDRHLHNGDPLTNRTTHVPAGRPASGNPPFAWQDSAIDAMKLRKIHQVSGWNLPRLLYELEGYNGWGYRKFHQHVRSPYLWSYSNHYSRGKYVADGTWSDTAISRQCGAAVLIKRLEQRGTIPLFSAIPAAQGVPLQFSTQEIDRAEDLQRFLNTFPGIVLRVDGKPGEKTSDAVKQVFGFHLQGDPRSDAA